MHIAVDEVMREGPALVRALRRRAQASDALKGAPFSMSPGWFSFEETQSLDRLARALQSVLDDALTVFASHPALRRGLAPRPRALRWADPPEGIRTSVALGAWSRALPWLHDRSLPSPLVRIRPDGYLIEGKLRLVEINLGSMPSHHVDALPEVFMEHSSMRSLLAGRVPARSSAVLAETLQKNSRALVGHREGCAAVLLGPGHCDANSAELVRALKAEGLRVIEARPWQLRWNGRELSVEGDRATLVVRGGYPVPFAGFSMPARLHAKACISLAYAHRAAWFYPVPWERLFSKIFLALLSDGTLDGLIPEGELTLVRDHVAWTRVTRPGPTRLVDGSVSDLRRHCQTHQADLVLKPSFGSAGNGVCLGDSVSEAAWRQLLDRAFAYQDYVVQERLRPSPVEVALPSVDGLRRVQVIHDVCPVIVDGNMAAVWCRFSASAMTGFYYNKRNATEAYGFLPTWVTRTTANKLS